MKFTYNKDEPDTRECVAYMREINGQFNLSIKTDQGCAIIYDGDVDTPHHGSNWDWLQEVGDAAHKFYRGDSITITF